MLYQALLNDRAHLLRCQLSVVPQKQLSVFFYRRILKLPEIKLKMLIPNVNTWRLFVWTTSTAHLDFKNLILLVRTFNSIYDVGVATVVLSIVKDENEGSDCVRRVVIEVSLILVWLVFGSSQGTDCT